MLRPYYHLAMKSCLFVTDDETLEAIECEDITNQWLKLTLQEIE